MKISSLLALAAAQHAERGKGKPGKPGKPSKHHDSDEVNLFEALRIISGRYEDLQIKTFDDSRYLRKKIEKFSRKIYKKVNQLDQNGCIIYERDNDLKEKISKQDVASFHSAGAKLKQDMNEILNYFTGEEKKKCRKFKNGTVKKIDAVCNYIDSKPNVSEFKLNSPYAGFDNVKGRVSTTGKSVVFDGIKYGEANRFEHSTPVVTLSRGKKDPSENDFTQPSFSCPIASNVLTGAETLSRTTEENEDCLYLKIIAPTSAFDGSDKKKVIVWIHGGTFNFGGIDVQYEDPTPLVEEQDIIVVKMNYRLGPFGNWFLDNGQTNFGIGDQRLAMKWVKDNIASFNGDAENITLAGASAGGHGVTIHLTHEDSWSYFKNAIVMSATQLAFWPEVEARAGYREIAIDYLGCTNDVDYETNLADGSLLQCLQGASLGSLQSTLAYLGSIFSAKALAAGRLTQMEFTYTPNYDGITLIEDPRVLISRGEIKPDMDFVIFEVTSDEAETMTRNIFGSETMQQILFPNDHTSLFNDSNSHISVSQAAWEALVSSLFSSGIDDMILADDAFGCGYDTDNGSGDGGSGDNGSGEGSGRMFTEVQVDFTTDRTPEVERTNDPLTNDCTDPAADFFNGLLFTCPLDQAFTSFYSGQSGSMPTNLYAVQYKMGTPGPGPDTGAGFLLPYNDSFYGCFEQTNRKSCHIEGAHVFFGEAINQEITITDQEAQFGVYYRTLYADIIKGNGSSLNQVYEGKWNVLDIDETDFHTEVQRPMHAKCDILTQLDLYGKL